MESGRNLTTRKTVSDHILITEERVENKTLMRSEIFSVSVGESVRTSHTVNKPEKFQDAALFLRLGLPSTLIRHQNGAFLKRSVFHCQRKTFWKARFLKSTMQYIKYEIQFFIGISRHWEESWKYDTQRSIFDEIRGVWIADVTLSRVLDIPFQSKQKIRCKRRSEIVKIYAS